MQQDIKQQVNQTAVDIFSDYLGIGFNKAVTYRVTEKIWFIRAEDHGDVYHGMVNDPVVLSELTADEIIKKSSEISAEFYAETIATKGVE